MREIQSESQSLLYIQGALHGQTHGGTAHRWQLTTPNIPPLARLRIYEDYILLLCRWKNPKEIKSKGNKEKRPVKTDLGWYITFRPCPYTFTSTPQIYKQKTKRAILWAKKNEKFNDHKAFVEKFTLKTNRWRLLYTTSYLRPMRPYTTWPTQQQNFGEWTSKRYLLQSQIITTTLKKIMPRQPLTQYLINQATARGDSKTQRI